MVEYARPVTDAVQIPLACPEISDADVEAVTKVMRSGQLSCGPRVESFERALARAVGTRHAVAVANGTCALHLIVRGLGIGPGDEVVTTPYSFVASANCILFEGASPVFADIDRTTYALDPGRAEEAITPRTKAILAVDVFGRLADWKSLVDIARRHRLHLIEDSCEALGTPGAGTFGQAGAFGFYPNKQLTCGEGGAVVTDDPELAGLARSLRNQGRAAGESRLVHERLGFNYRLSDIACALLESQLGRLDRIVATRARVASWYNHRLRGTGLRLPMSGPAGVSWFVYVVELPADIPTGFKEDFIARLRQRGIGAGAYFPAIHLQPFYRSRPASGDLRLPNAEYVAARTVALPFSTLLTENDVDRVCDGVVRVMREAGTGGAD